MELSIEKILSKEEFEIFEGIQDPSDTIDYLGPDPFETRVLNVIEKKSFALNIKNLNLMSKAILDQAINRTAAEKTPVIGFIDKQSMIPKLLNFIWVGSCIQQGKGVQDTIKSWRKIES